MENYKLANAKRIVEVEANASTNMLYVHLIIIVISFAILGFSCGKSSVTSLNNGYNQEGKTVDGKKEGEWVTFQDGKRVASITYKDGLKNGLVLSGMIMGKWLIQHIIKMIQYLVQANLGLKMGSLIMSYIMILSVG